MLSKWLCVVRNESKWPEEKVELSRLLHKRRERAKPLPRELNQHVDLKAVMKNAYIMLDVDGTLLNADDPSVENRQLCFLLRGKRIHLLTAMGPDTLSSVAAMACANAEEPSYKLSMTREQLIKRLWVEYAVSVERVITPADAKYCCEHRDKKAGAAFRDFIKPHYPGLNTALKDKKRMEAVGEYKTACHEFQKIEYSAAGPRTSKGEALRHFLHEHDADKKPIVFFDDNERYLRDVEAVCVSEGWPVLCYKVSSRLAHSTIQRFANGKVIDQPLAVDWKVVMVNRLKDYVSQRKLSGEYYGGILFKGVGFSRTKKLQAAHALISLLGGEQSSRLYSKRDAEYELLVAALSQKGCLRDSHLLRAICSVPGLPETVCDKKGKLCVGKLLDHLRAEADIRAREQRKVSCRKGTAELMFGNI